jgi:cbb3-type cytochrome oxidase subunit 3
MKKIILIAIGIVIIALLAYAFREGLTDGKKNKGAGLKFEPIKSALV